MKAVLVDSKYNYGDIVYFLSEDDNEYRVGMITALFYNSEIYFSAERGKEPEHNYGWSYWITESKGITTTVDEYNVFTLQEIISKYEYCFQVEAQKLKELKNEIYRL